MKAEIKGIVDQVTDALWVREFNDLSDLFENWRKNEQD